MDERFAANPPSDHGPRIAASVLQSGGAGSERSSPPSDAMRTTLQLVPAMRTGLKRRAVDLDATMGRLIRDAISSGLQEPAKLAAASMELRGVTGGVRTTLDLPRGVHRALKRLAADEDTSLQALIVAAIRGAYPDLA
jgi:hypothetical protein